MKKILLLLIASILAVSAISCKKEVTTPGLTPGTAQSGTQNNTQGDASNTTNDEGKAQSEVQNNESKPANTTKERNLMLYFPDKNLQYLHGEERNLNADDASVEWAIVYELIKGPQSENLTAAINGGVEIISLEIKDGLCTVDLSAEFASENTGGSAKENMAIYALVNSLCEVDRIDKVKINIEGNTQAEFGELLLDEALEPNKDIISQE